jgi:hypothetical protein
MLNITSQLLSYLKQKDRHFEIGNTYVNAILKCGEQEDIDAVFEYFLANIEDFYTSDLNIIIAKTQNPSHAGQLFEDCLENGRLKEGVDESVLKLLGQLQYEKALPILVYYAFESESYYHSASAVKGLLHFDCKGLEERIKTEIEKIYNESFFLEFIPALVCKLKERDEILQNLYETGSTVCSTDCNAGIILGFSLCGEQGKEYFKKALFDPYWEAFLGSTGTVWAVYEGMVNLHISFAELFDEIKEMENLRHGLYLLFELLSCKIFDNGKNIPDPQSFRQVFEALYLENDLVELARKEELQDEAYRLKELLEARMSEEMILNTLITN